MKAKEIKVGGHYRAKISGRVVTVRVDAIRHPILVRAGRDSETTVDGKYHAPSYVHPASCPGCTLDESKHGQPVTP